MSVSQGLRHPWITEKAADVPLSTGGCCLSFRFRSVFNVLTGVHWLCGLCYWAEAAAVVASLCALVRHCAQQPCAQQPLAQPPLGPAPPRPNRPSAARPPAAPACAEIISRLQSFTHQNRIKCLLMTIAAHHLSDEEIGGLRKVGAAPATPFCLLLRFLLAAALPAPTPAPEAWPHKVAGRATVRGARAPPWPASCPAHAHNAPRRRRPHRLPPSADLPLHRCRPRRRNLHARPHGGHAAHGGGLGAAGHHAAAGGAGPRPRRHGAAGFL